MDDVRAGWRTFETPSGPRGVADGSEAVDGTPGRQPPDRASAGDAIGRVREAAPGILPLALAAAAGAVIAAAFVLAFGGTGGATVILDPGATAGPSASDAVAAGPGASDVGVVGGRDTAGGDAAATILVDVEGGVARPGVVRLAAGARVGDAVAAAGGYGPSVDATRAAVEINLAARLQDGDRLRVPAVGDPASAGGVDGTADTAATGGGGAAVDPAGGATGGAVRATSADGRVDLNRATAAELEALPAIGPATAAKIIEARTTAPFTRVSDLRDRKVVSASTYGKIEALVTVGP